MPRNISDEITTPISSIKRDVLKRKSHHFDNFSSRVTLEIIIFTVFDAARNENIVKMTYVKITVKRYNVSKMLCKPVLDYNHKSLA